MKLRARLSPAVLPLLLCLACGVGSDAEPQTAAVSIAPVPTLDLHFPPAGRDAHALATTFLTATLEYDAADATSSDFLRKVGSLTTPAELARLRGSSRAQLPWDALRARGERTQIHINGITRVDSSAHRLRVLVRLTLVTQTEFATVRSLEQAMLTVVDSGGDWKVDYAIGAGL